MLRWYMVYYFCLGYSQEFQRKFHALQETRRDPSLWCSVGRHGQSWSLKFDFCHPSKSAKRDCFLPKKSRQSWSSAWQVAAAAIIFKMEAWWFCNDKNRLPNLLHYHSGFRSKYRKHPPNFLRAGNLPESSAPRSLKRKDIGAPNPSICESHVILGI